MTLELLFRQPNAALIVAVFQLTVFGLAWIVGHSKLTQAPRETIASWGRMGMRAGFAGFFLNLIECPACLSFWLGLITAGAYAFSFWASLAVGIFAAGCSFILARITGLIP